MLSHRLNTLFSRTGRSDSDVDETVLPKWFTDIGSVVVGLSLTVQAVLSGAPIVESLLGGTIAGAGVFLAYSIARIMGFPPVASEEQRPRRTPARSSRGRSERAPAASRLAH